MLSQKEDKNAHKSNRLAQETSPYLLQHATNPVDWYPWGEEARQKAKTENKPILLSIGYAACHWCHVMEHESFSDQETARLMNDLFICIKVDREERPEIDQLYMTYVQMTTGSGGWPLNVFLTPDLEPFYGGTYFPPDNRYGRPSWRNVLQQVSRFYHEEKTALKENLHAIRQAFEESIQSFETADIPAAGELETIALYFKGIFDSAYGGFGGAPKFPAIQPLAFLLRHYHRTDKKEYLQMVELTLRKMAQGGIYDQIGGGFARYSVDDTWLVPHFEKMLYDNAQLVPLYIDAYLLTGDNFYADIAKDVLSFVSREMTSPQGGFYSSLDADSEGEEGKYYLWSKAEIDSILKDDSELFCAYYDITAQGNYEGKNILHPVTSKKEIADRFKISESSVADKLKAAKEKLLAVRNLRIKPGLDDKIITSWNALMLSAFARGYQVFKDPEYKKIIEQNISFLKTNLYKNGYLLRTYNRKKAHIDAYLEDYAFLIKALTDAYQAVLEPSYLAWAHELMQRTNSDFRDAKQGDYFVTRTERKDLLYRLKDEYDQSIPSGISVMLYNNLFFFTLTDDANLLTFSEEILKKYGSRIIKNPYGYASYLSGLELYQQRPKEIFILYTDQNALEKYYEIVFSAYQPFIVIIVVKDDEILPFLSANLYKGKSLKQDKTTAYICHNFVCSPPILDIDSFKQVLFEQKSISS